MRIEGPAAYSTAERAGIAAMVHWEDCSRPSQELFFETESAYSEELFYSPHAFLVGCLIPAMFAGEQRIAVEGKVCPELLDGLKTVQAIMSHWYGPDAGELQIEADPSYMPRVGRRETTGSFLSGGLDSLALLRMNALLYPPEHPRAIQDCLIVHGFDMGHEDPRNEGELFQRAVQAVSPIASEAGVRLIPIVTNVRTLHSSVDFWMEKFSAAALASVAHAFSQRLTSVLIASSDQIGYFRPYATHPLLDPQYGSSELQIRHEGIRFSRLDKMRVVAAWPTALDNLRVCTRNDPAFLNCGTCEKCIRTMVMLMAIGKLGETVAFPASDLSAELLSTIYTDDPFVDKCYRETVPLLAQQGRHDLVAIIEQKSAEFQRRQKWEREEDWKGAIKKFDRRWMGARLFRLYAGLRAQL